MYDDRDLLLAMYNVPQKYDPGLISAVLADLTPDRCRALWTSKALEVRGAHQVAECY